MSERLALADRVLEVATLHGSWRARRDQAAAEAAASDGAAQAPAPEHDVLLKQSALLAGAGRAGSWGLEARTRRVLHPASPGAAGGRSAVPEPWLRALNQATAGMGLEVAAGNDAQAEALGLALAMGIGGPAAQ